MFENWALPDRTDIHFLAAQLRTKAHAVEAELHLAPNLNSGALSTLIMMYHAIYIIFRHLCAIMKPSYDQYREATSFHFRDRCGISLLLTAIKCREPSIRHQASHSSKSVLPSTASPWSVTIRTRRQTHRDRGKPRLRLNQHENYRRRNATSAIRYRVQPKTRAV